MENFKVLILEEMHRLDNYASAAERKPLKKYQQERIEKLVLYIRTKYGYDSIDISKHEQETEVIYLIPTASHYLRTRQIVYVSEAVHTEFEGKV